MSQAPDAAASLSPRARNAAFMQALRANLPTALGLKVSEHYPGTIHIERLVRDQGQDAMRHLAALADAHQVDLFVQPQALAPEDTTDRLRAWYRQFGFQDDGVLYMRRKPARSA